MAERFGQVFYDGLIGPVSASYTMSHGISPGLVVIRAQPQSIPPNADGTVLITDGFSTIRLPSCRVGTIRIDDEDGAYIWNIEIYDRRWKWMNLGYISGSYNQYDPFGKLLPWTIRSPFELIELCLQAMGETRYTILNAPPGLNNPGPNFPFPVPNISGVNPPIDWDAVPPAQALSALCDQFGLRVIYRWDTDSILIAKYGIGGALPGGSIYRGLPSIRIPQTPDGVMVEGSPTRYQMLFYLQAVGEEWDGSYRPINELSYAPIQDKKVQITKVIIHGTVAPGMFWYVKVNNYSINQEYLGGFTDVSSPGNIIVFGFRATQHEDIKGKISTQGAIVGADYVITFTGLTNDSFVVHALRGGIEDDESYIEIVDVQAAEKGRKGWGYSPPPLFPNVTPTDRLTFFQAQALAQKSVYKCFRIKNHDPRDPKKPLVIPSYGLINRREQILLENTKVDQIVPTPQDANLIDSGTGNPFTVNLYNGYSRDQPGELYGSTFIGLQNALWQNDDTYVDRNGNTNPNKRVFIEFNAVPEFQMVVLNNYAFRMINGEFYEPYLFLLTACQIRSYVNNSIECMRVIRAFPNATGIMFQVCKKPDVQLNVSTTWEFRGAIPILRKTSVLEADPIVRAQYYLDGASVQYLIEGGETRIYNGIAPCVLDGAISQITWRVGGGDVCQTQASINYEHSIFVPPFPARRRAEFLAPIVQGNKPVQVGLDNRLKAMFNPNPAI